MRPDREIERELEGLGERIRFPPTPELARSVRRRLEGGEDRSARRAWLPAATPRWAAAAALLVLVLALPIFSPAARDVLFGGAGIGRGEGGGAQSGAGNEDARGPADLPEAVPEDTGGPMPSSGGAEGAADGGPLPSSTGGGSLSIGAGLEFGERISLPQARTLAGRPILLPDLGRPDEIYALRPPHEDGVALVYWERPGLPALGETGAGLVLVELPGDDVGAAFLRGGEPKLEEVRVDGRPGYWAPDGLPSSVGATGTPGAGALIWPEADRVLKLEAKLTKEEAVRIAASVR